MLLCGQVVLPTGMVDDGAVILDGPLIGYAGPRKALPAPLDAVEPRPLPAGSLLLPGLVDLHTHGAGGGEFGTSTASARRAADTLHRSGTTTIVASMVSGPPAMLRTGVQALAPLVAEGVLAGIHLEGPFLAGSRCGAHDPCALTDPDLGLVEELAAIAGPGGLTQLTYAPERAGATELPEVLTRLDIIGAIGHTQASAAQSSAALEALHRRAARGGRPLVTHLFNAMPPLSGREPGPVAAALAAAAAGRAVVELIADGVHLDAATVQVVHATLGPDNIALVSDSTAARGLAEGRHTLGTLEVDVRAGAARLAHRGALAGGLSSLLEQVRWCVHTLGIPLLDAVRMAATTPAAVLGRDDVGRLVAGAQADVIVAGPNLELLTVYRAGEQFATDPPSRS